MDADITRVDTPPKPSGGFLEPHTLTRWCGHQQTLSLAPPWEYVETVAALVVCPECRGQGKRGPLDTDHAGVRLPI